MLQEYADRIDFDLSTLKNFFNEMRDEKVQKLFKAKEVDVQPDNLHEIENDIKDYKSLQSAKDVLNFNSSDGKLLMEEPSKFGHHTNPKLANYIPDKNENTLTKARTFSFEQLFDFFNLCLNKSMVKKRTRSSEEEIYKLQNQLKEFQEWRDDLETRLANKHTEIQTKFDDDNAKNDERFATNKKEHKRINEGIYSLEMGLKTTNKTIKQHKEEANDIASNLETLSGVVE